MPALGLRQGQGTPIRTGSVCSPPQISVSKHITLRRMSSPHSKVPLGQLQISSQRDVQT